jgi:hypothetical protein
MSVSCEIWVHDAAVDGGIHAAPGRRVIRVDRTWPALRIATEAKAAAVSAGGATTLWILAHGSITGMSLAEAEGGWEDSLFGGLTELGEDGVTSRNVAAFGTVLRGVFADSIRILICGGAARWNGFEICRRLAYQAQTLVIASQDAQEYTVDHARGGLLNIGPWEGRVFRFLPSGEAAAWFVGPTASGSEAPRRSVVPRMSR